MGLAGPATPLAPLAGTFFGRGMATNLEALRRHLEAVYRPRWCWIPASVAAMPSAGRNRVASHRQVKRVAAEEAEARVV